MDYIDDMTSEWGGGGGGGGGGGDGCGVCNRNADQEGGNTFRYEIEAMSELLADACAGIGGCVARKRAVAWQTQTAEPRASSTQQE